ncbi:MAG: hypothetical protein ACIAQZ_12440 [Sedimentisphaeraceae bacterium JB056]
MRRNGLKKSQKRKSLSEQIKQKHDKKLIQRYVSSLNSYSGNRTRNYKRRIKSESFEILDKVYDISIRGHISNVYFEPYMPFDKQFEDCEKLPFTGDLEKELNWIGFIILKHADVINKYLRLKNQYEKAVLTGEYAIAKEIIQDILKSFGFSLWAINELLFIAESCGGLKENREVLQTISEKCGNSIKILLSFCSSRIETANSWSNYNKDCEAFIKRHWHRESIRHILSFMEFSIKSPIFDNFGNLDSVAYILSGFPLIDRYIGFIRILQVMIANGVEIYQLNLSDLISEINNVIKDPLLDMIVYSLTNNISNLNLDNKENIEIIDQYTRGQYCNSRDIAHEALRESPNVFEYYEIYLKSVIHGKFEFKNPFDEKCHSYKILLWMYNVLSRNHDMFDSMNSLIKESYVLSSMSLSQHLLHFVNENSCDANLLYSKRMALLNDSQITPRLKFVFNSHGKALSFLDDYEQINGNSITLNHFKVSHCAEYTDDVPLIRQQKYKALYFLRTNAYDEAKSIYELMLKKDQLPLYYLKDIIHNLVICYIRSEEVDNCVELTLNMYYNDNKNVSLGTWQYIAENIDISVEKIGVKAPILMNILQQEKIYPRDGRKLYELLEDYLNDISIEKPSEITHSHDAEKRHIIYLLRNVCVINILEDFFVFNNMKELENERVEICRILQYIDSNNFDYYSAEIKDIAQIQTTRESVHSIDKCKVHIDIPRLYDSLEKDLEESFSRWKEYSYLEERLRKPPMLDSDSESPMRIALVDPSIKIFDEIFTQIQNHFLSSNEYGLDCYLSVRIRHGTLDGQIRSIFSKNNLLTLKIDSKDEYAENEFWNHKIFIESNKCVLAKKYWKLFSKTIDDEIYFLRNDLIQIRNKNHQVGLFDYDFNESEKKVFWIDVVFNKNISQYKELLDYIVTILIDRTKKNLHEVKKYIQGELKVNFLEALDELESNIISIDENADVVEFKDTIKRVKTDLENGLREIAKWFNLADKPNFNCFFIEQLIKTVEAIVKKCHPGIVLNVNYIGEKDKVKFEGSAFISMIDIFFIIFDNIAKHSGLTKNDVGVSLKIDDSINITISNKLDKSCDIDEIERKLDSIEGGSIKTSLIRSEGGTGFIKIKKILKYDLYHSQNKLSYNIDRSNRLFNTVVSLSKGIIDDHSNN